MKTCLRKIGNSTGAIIPSNILSMAGLETGDELDIDFIDGQLIIKTAQPNYTLDQLLKGVTEEMVTLNDEDKRWLGSSVGLEIVSD